MERVELPTGVTIDGKELYFREKQVKDTKSERLPTDKHLKRHRSLKGKAFKQERTLGKRQRVIETIIYDKERIKDMEYKKYILECQEHLKKSYPDVILSRLIPSAVGVDRRWKENSDVTNIINDMGETNGLKRKHSTVSRQNLSFHLSSLWRDKKAITLFVERQRSRPFTYRMTDMGYLLGPALVTKYMTERLPSNPEALRLRLSDMRQLAKTRGVSEVAFNKFIAERYEKVMKEPVSTLPKNLKRKKKEVSNSIDDMPLKEVVERTTLAVAPESKSELTAEGTGFTTPKIVQAPEPSFPLPPEQIEAVKNDESKDEPLTPEATLEYKDLPDDTPLIPKPEPITESKVDVGPATFSKIKFNIKIWIIPITGEIELI